MIGFMPTEGVGAIGSLDVPPEERRRLAKRSLDWVCPVCGLTNRDALSPVQDGDSSSQDKTMAEAADIVTQMAFKVDANHSSAVVVEAQVIYCYRHNMHDIYVC